MRKRPANRTWGYLLGLAALAAFIGFLVWTQTSLRSIGDELQQSKADNAALAEQVRSLGGQPVAEAKPGERGDRGPQGIQGPPGPQGPPGITGPQGPIGITGQSPQCLLEPSKCVGPKGAAGVQGPEGPQGDTGPQGETGPQGPAGPQGDPGTTGPAGPQGDPGRGIVSGPTCTGSGQDSYWLTVYTDGTEQRQDGPCRIDVVPPVEPGTGTG